jgi:hypothetical protein
MKIKYNSKPEADFKRIRVKEGKGHTQGSGVWAVFYL